MIMKVTLLSDITEWRNVGRESLGCEVADMLGCNIVVGEFEFQLSNYVHFYLWFK